MRQTFINTLCKLASKDKRVWLLTADLGFGIIEKFRDKFPDRFINVGVAEQNMIGIATGLAIKGFIPWCYTISTFATMRGLEQIRHAAYHNLPIRIVGVGGGFAYGTAGFTHWGLEDIALMRSLQNMGVVAPRCPSSLKEIMNQTVNIPGPIYLRLDKDQQPELSPQIAINSNSLVIGMGTMSHTALEVANKIGADYAAAEWINPLLRMPVRLYKGEYNRIITVEEHYIKGGLFSAICENMAGDLGNHVKIVPFAVKDIHLGKVGSREWCLNEYGLSVNKIVENLVYSE
jgi:transketolase